MTNRNIHKGTEVVVVVNTVKKSLLDSRAISLSLGSGLETARLPPKKKISIALRDVDPNTSRWGAGGGKRKQHKTEQLSLDCDVG